MNANPPKPASLPTQPLNVAQQLDRDLAEPLLRRILVTIVVAGLALSAAAAAGRFPRTLLLAAANTAIAAAMIAAARRGHARLASIAVTLSLTATTAYAMMTGVGVFDDSLLIIPGLFVLASLLLNTRWLIFVVVLTMGAIITTGLAQIRGRIVIESPLRVRYEDIIEILIILSALAAFVHYLVSTLRRIALESRAAHQSVQDILDATSEAIFIHNACDGQIVSVNKPTLEMFGASQEDFLGLTPTDLQAADPQYDGTAAAEFIRRAVTEGPQSFEWMTQRKDGSKLWVEVALRGARIANQDRVVAVVRDISARRQLEQRVREAETFRAVGQLAGGVAHDFNNQLVGILGHAEFLQEALEARPELRDCADSILASGKRAAELTRQLLAFARRGRRCNVPVDLHQLVAEVIALGRRSIDKRIMITQQLDAAAASTFGDPSALQNALLNLLLNARDAMPKGGTVRFATRNIAAAPLASECPPSSAPARCIELTVTDTGVGIDPDHLDKIFEPFFTTKESGTGMGLAAVKGTVLEHQGAIEVISTKGIGTTIRVVLPASGIEVSQEPADKAAELTTTHGRILVVDDEASVAKVIKATLDRGGYAVEVCTNGQAALDRFGAASFDMVLLDVMMPDLDGVEVLRRIRATAPTAKVVLMTGHTSESLEARMREFSDIIVLSKPFQPKELLKSVRKVMAS